MKRNLSLEQVSGVVFFLVFCHASPAMAQAKAKSEVDQLRTPSAPGFVLLGVEPASVERPTTPKTFAFSLLSAFKNGDTLPKNYALEAAPYWLFPHQSLTYDGYMKAGVGQTLLQTVSLSLVTSTEEHPANTDAALAAAPTTKLAMGLRAQLLSGHASQALIEARKELEAAQAEALDVVSDADTAPSRRTGPPPTPEDFPKVKAAALKIQKLDKERVGFLLEGAGALALNYAESKAKNAELSRWGAWATAGYRLDKPRLEIIGVLRYQRDALAEQSLLDAGGRANFKLGELSLGGEYVHRWAPDDDFYRLAGILEYQIQSGVYLSATFGRNFENGATGNLISILGLNFGLGSDPKL